MKAVGLLRYLKGYVKFRADGGFSERFINLCAAKNIPLFNSTYINCGVCAETDIKNFPRLRETARKTGVRISVISKSGFAFYFRKKRHRTGLIVGAVFYVTFIVVMNMFVWNIEAGGSEKYSSEQLIASAEKVGVKYGICRFIFDEKKAAREIYKAFSDELSWVAVNIIGSKCYISVRDNNDSGKDENLLNREPSNLIADFDGVILSDETYSGIKTISKGNAVKEGDLLISGVMDNENGTAVYYCADGNFTARHNRYFESSIYKSSYLQPVSMSSKATAVLFGVPIKFGESKKQSNEYSFLKVLMFDNHPLPFSYTITFTADEKDVALSEKQCLLLSADFYTQTTYSVLGNTKIISYDIKVLSQGQDCSIQGEYDCIDFIGISKPIIVENIESK